MRLVAAFLVSVLVLAGCVSPASNLDPAAATTGVTDLVLGDATLRAVAAQGGLASLALQQGGDVSVTFPEGVLVQTADGRLVKPDGAVLVKSGDALSFLPPYGASSVKLGLALPDGTSEERELALGAGSRLVSGEYAVDLMRIQRDQFPHKTPGHENYGKAIHYFASEFKAFGYDVEINEYADAAKVPVGSQPGPASLSSVVAYKRGTASPERFIVFGGHFDVVEQTTEGAFDNTAGAIATLALASAMQNITTDHTLVFAAWGGEEDGIVGSNAWVTSNPHLVPFIDAYVNFDVTPLAWPAPANDPAPIVIAAGPDGALAGTLHDLHKEVVTTWMQIDAPFVYEGVVEGQAMGAGVNAQSDHTPFMARGVPVYFPFTSRVPDVFGLIHSERDTLDNMTKYALFGLEGLDAELTPEERTEGERVLARSFETNMVFGFYFAVLVDNGVLKSPAPTAGFRV